jgi:integrase
MTAQQADDVITKTAADRMHAYIVVSLLTGARTEELRALRWEHVHLEGRPDVTPPVPPFVEVWRSVRAGGDTKTMQSRRTIALPDICVRSPHSARSAGCRTPCRWRTMAGDRLGVHDAAWYRYGCRECAPRLPRVLALVPGLDPEEWTPRELRHSFVSLLSDAGVPIEDVSRLVGHSSTSVTELVYRHQIRPVIQSGATIMDRLLVRRPALPRLSSSIDDQQVSTVATVGELQIIGGEEEPSAQNTN